MTNSTLFTLENLQKSLFPLREQLIEHEVYNSIKEEQHSPMASQMLKELCGEETSKWKEAEKAAHISLNARTTLWDRVVAEINLNNRL
ncbi:DUF3050 domain-containing protein [Merismopedia glauca]|uniref:Uncharacterized protein n=1 Tax=Merismopedia glauca CCAP 1448/3 TaxID=1296344 RepID=A0A2T1BX87_9CYAN|nr:DUF3050 domain-containing protein [Merismopedia glauca]PSB00568.1 hypothetical protein C7B64_22835 [Merismopedia glauca CCAP 1448/3]